MAASSGILQPQHYSYLSLSAPVFIGAALGVPWRSFVKSPIPVSQHCM